MATALLARLVIRLGLGAAKEALPPAGPGRPAGDEDEAEAPAPFGQLRPSERRALIGCAFAAGCILLMPGELIGSGISFLLAIGLGLWHRRASKREKAASQAAALASADG